MYTVIIPGTVIAYDKRVEAEAYCRFWSTTMRDRRVIRSTKNGHGVISASKVSATFTPDPTTLGQLENIISQFIS